MSKDYRQTDTSATGLVSNICRSITAGNVLRLSMINGGTAGTTSRSTTVLTALAAVSFVTFLTPDGDPGTATWIGPCVVRFNITTSNANVTWAYIDWCEECSLSKGIVTATSGLGIGLGTTGIKTASVEATGAYTNVCNSASASVMLQLGGSTGAAMPAIFVWQASELITLPFTDSAAPAPTTIFTIAQMGAGQG